MIIVVDNGKGSREISGFLRSKSQIIKPGEIKGGSAFVLSDGRVDGSSKKSIDKLLEKTGSPVLGIGAGMGYILSFYGAQLGESKASQKQESVSMKKPSPILLDFKRMFSVVKSSSCVVKEVPENFSVHASSKSCEFEVVQEMEKPFFGVHFNPELGQDGLQILRNFEKFIEIWEKYHKGN